MPSKTQPKKSELTKAAETLQEEAKSLAGVADVLRIYGQIEQTLEVVQSYQPRSITTSAAGNCTA